MELTLLIVNFLNDDWSGRYCELRSEGKPYFWIQTGDYRPLQGLEIGAETIINGTNDASWDNSLDDPIDHWLYRSADRVAFEIAYLAVSPPQSRVGGYNLVLPPTWWFAGLKIYNPNRYGGRQMIASDPASKREALKLYFRGDNSPFKVEVEAAQGAKPDRRHLDADFEAEQRPIFEPQPRR